MMNHFLEYLRYLLVAVLLLGILAGLVFLATRAGQRGNRHRALQFAIAALVLSIPLGRYALTTVFAFLLSGPLPSEATLISDMEQKIGVQLPNSARVTTYRTMRDFFGDWGGLLKANIACSDIGQLKQPSELAWDSQARYDVLTAPKAPMLDAWQRSRFTIPAGAQVVVIREGTFDAVYAVDAANCTVHYQRLSI